MAPRLAQLIAIAALGVARPAVAQVESALPPITPVSVAPDDVAHGQIRFRAFGAAEGLRNLVVVSLAQDRAGMLWVATDDGLYRYDGEQLTHYAMRDGLPAMGVRVLGVAPDGNLCAGTRDGLVCWDGARFSTVGAAGLPPVWIQGLAAGPDALWAGTSAGLYVRRGNSFARAPGWPGSGRPVKAIWADAEGVVVGDGAILRVSRGDGAWQVLDANVGLDRERIDTVLRDRDGTLWIRSAHHLWTLPRGAAAVADWSAGLPSGVDLSGIACGMALSPWGDVLVGSDRGIAYRRGETWRMIDGAVGLPGREARALFVDREGTVWIGSLGLFQWLGRGLITRHDPASGLPGDVVWSIDRDRAGTLWIGTGHCLARLTDVGWACLPATRGVSVRSFVPMPDGGIFAGGEPPDLDYLDADGARHVLALPGERTPDRHVLALALGPEGDLWIATTAGLFRLRGAVPGTPERVVVPGVRPDARYISLLNTNGQLWAAGDMGLVALDGGHGRDAWHVFDRSAGLRATAMRHVIRRAAGTWCVTYTDVDGVTCFVSDGRALSHVQGLGSADGLTSGRIYFLGEDHVGRLWIGTGNGVDVLTADGADHFDEADGLVGNDSAARAFFEDRDGSLWLGASNGVSHLRAQHYRGPPPPPRITLLGGTLGGRALGAGRALAPHDRSSLTARFAADGFLNPRRVELQVRLSPLEREWSTTPLREARYPALPPGAYRLEMRARTDAGAWGPTTVLPFAIEPAWWQTRGFLLAAIVLGLGGLAGAVSWRQRVLWRRRARQLQQQSDASFRDLIEAMPDLVAVYREGKLDYLNEAAREALGLDASSWRGGSLLPSLHPDDHAVAGRLMRSSVAQLVELRFRAADGGWRHCELSSRRITLGDAPVLMVSGRDVTERHRMRAQLLLSDRLVSLGTLAAGIAHEINNPLAYVTGNLEVVAESLDSDTGADHAERKAAIADAREGAERVRQIVRGLRSFSRGEEEQRAALALPDVIDAAIRLTGNELRHRAVLRKELGSTPRVLADEGRLAQVLINLLINAAHAIPEGHSDDHAIVVRSRTDAHGRAVVEVEDSGTGMPPEVQARAFDPFFTTKAVGEGTGLGLSICHGIVTGLGGQITIESAPVRGSLVRVVLPPAPAETVVVRAVEEPSGGTARRHRVLIVDDDPRVAQAMQRMLHSDHDLTVATCGADAIAHVASGTRFDAIVTDVMMPNMTGIELFDRLADVAPDQAMRVIFLSGGVFTAQTQARLEAAGNPQLQKPVTSQELRACVAALVARAA